jgi:hypothetical protein
VGTEHEKTSDYCRVIIDDRGDPLKRHLPRILLQFRASAGALEFFILS